MRKPSLKRFRRSDQLSVPRYASSGEPAKPDRLERKILAFIAQHTVDRGYPPTIREIAEHIGFSISATHYRLALIERAGWVSRAAHTPRSIVIRLPQNGFPR